MEELTGADYFSLPEMGKTRRDWAEEENKMFAGKVATNIYSGKPEEGRGS